MGTELFLVPFFIFWQDHLSSKPLWAFLIFESISHVYFELLIYRLGAHYRSSNVGTEQDIPVEKIISHHSYRKPYGMAHDIAMVKLSRPATLNKAVNIACLPGSGGDVADGKMCWVTGRRNEKLKWSKLPKHSMSLQLNWIYMEVRRNWVHNGYIYFNWKARGGISIAPQSNIKCYGWSSGILTTRKMFCLKNLHDHASLLRNKPLTICTLVYQFLWQNCRVLLSIK